MVALKSPNKNAEHVIARDENGHFLKGHVANPVGRPKMGHTSPELLRKIGAEQDANGTTQLERMLRKVYSEAHGGEMPAVRVVLDRTEGKVTQVFREEGGLTAYRNLNDDELDRAAEELEARVDSCSE